MSPYSFEVVGDIPSAWLDDLERFAVRLRAHPWGGQAAELLLCGNLPELLRKYMPPPRYAEWEGGYRAGRIAVTGAVSFTARDGRRAAAVFPLDDRSMLLMFAGHEFAEAALDRRHDAEGHVFEDGTNKSLAHVLWTEYVAERTRREIFDELALGYSVLDNGMVSEQIADIERELPELIRWAVQHNDLPPRIIQHWYELAPRGAIPRSCGRR